MTIVIRIVARYVVTQSEIGLTFFHGCEPLIHAVIVLVLGSETHH